MRIEYNPFNGGSQPKVFVKYGAPPVRLELTTNGFEVRYSVQLSYGGELANYTRFYSLNPFTQNFSEYKKLLDKRPEIEECSSIYTTVDSRKKSRTGSPILHPPGIGQEESNTQVSFYSNHRYGLTNILRI